MWITGRGRGRSKVVIVVGLLGGMQFERMLRGSILKKKELEYIEDARASGAGDFRIITRHILPNAVGPVIIAGTIDVAAAIIAESTLSFPGLGFPPDTPTLGRLLYDAKAYRNISAHWAPLPRGPLVIAGVALAVAIVMPLLVWTYAKTDQQLGGIPFFFWYQFLLVIVSFVLTSFASHLAIRHHRQRTAAEGPIQPK